MKRLGLRLFIALAVGGGLVGLAAVLVRVTRFHDFYAVCLWIALAAIGLAAVAVASFSAFAQVLPENQSGHSWWGEGYTPTDDSVSEGEWRSVGRYSLFLTLAALPCLVTALHHYWT
jgi:hypothetical protein